MELLKHYNSFYCNTIDEIRQNRLSVDPLISSIQDNRRGITLLLRPESETKKRVQQFLRTLEEIDPGQYYYTVSDMHVTVMSIISCYNGFTRNQIDEARYVEVIKKSIAEINPFRLVFNGITTSLSCE